MKKKYTFILISFFCLLLYGCGFYLQGEMQLAPPLHRMYLQTKDPYGYFARSLRQYLNLSHVRVVSSRDQAETVLVILQMSTSQELLGVSGTQQTRQYKLHMRVVFEITEPNGKQIVLPETLTESRIMTVQSNQILGSSNEANLYYQQMRRSLTYALMNRLASREITNTINNHMYHHP